MEKSLIQIIDIIQRFVDNYPLINSFKFGTQKQINSFIENNDEAPFLYVVPIHIQMKKNTQIYRLEFGIYDGRSKDDDNLIDVWSDTAQILKDIRQYLIDVFEIENVWTLRDEYTSMRPIVNYTNDWVSGWKMEMDIESLLLESDCLVPMINNITPPMPPDCGCSEDYYLKCSDLDDCQTIIDIIQSISDIPTFDCDVLSDCEVIQDIQQTIDGIGSNFGNTYFVTSGGDDTTGERGNINKPFRTISAARNRVVDDITNGDAVGETLIYVFPGTYIDEEEMQYENGNFYFTPGTTVIAKQRTWSPRTETALFILGKTPKHNTYYAENCNIYGQGKFYLGKSLDNDWNGYILYTEGSSNCYFECDLIDVDQGVGIHVQGNSVVNARGNTFNVRNGGYGATVREGSNTTFDFQTMYAYDTTFTVQTNFTGKCIFNVNNISGRSNVIGIAEMTPNSLVVINAPVIESVSGYGVEVKQNNAGDIYINGNIFGQNGMYTWFNRGPSTVTFNGNIMVRNLPVSLHHSSANWINSNEHKVYINGDIKSINGVANAILLRRGRLRLNGSLYNKKPDGTGIAFNGISITDNGVLIIDTFKIITDNLSVRSTVARDIKVIHSLASNKALNANITNILGSNIIIDNEIE